MKNYPPKVIKLDNFVTQNSNTKTPLQSLIKHICRETNRNKFNYNQLKYIFKAVRAHCDIEVPTKGRKLYELPSQAELRSFYCVISNPTHRLLFETLENTGLRISELCNLKLRRIDFDSNCIFIKEGKGKKDRVTVLGNKLKEKILLYLQGRNNRFLFESNRHTKYSTRRIQQLCKRYKEKARIDKVFTVHTFRHLWNTRLAKAGLSKERRMILAGHSSEKVQDIYTHLSVGGFKDEIITILDKDE